MSQGPLYKRGTSEVIEDHLRLRGEQKLEEDLVRNYHPEVVLLSAEGVNRGHDGVRKLADVLRSYAPKADFHYRNLLADGPYALIEWTAEGEDVHVHDGADCYVVHNGVIAAQAIHYSTKRR